MKKVIARFVMIICVVAILCSGCDNHKVDISKSDNIYCKSKVDYQITVPKTNLEQGDIYFCAPFYLLTNNEIHLIESEEGREYVIGEDATLEGENVDALNGGIVYLEKIDLKECIDDSFYENAARSYWVNYLNKDFSEEPDDDLKKEIKDVVSQVADNCVVLAMNITYSGTINDKVKLERVVIDDLNFEYAFENFEIDLIDAKDVAVNTSECIQYSTFGGQFLDGMVYSEGFIPLEGIAIANLKKINVKSLNDQCILINSDNYDDFPQLEENYGNIDYPKNDGDFSMGEDISMEYTYFFDVDNMIIDSDAKMASLVIEVVDDNGNTCWDVVYQPSVTDGPYLLLNYVYELLGQ